jgi:stage V sporulation protein S
MELIPVEKTMLVSASSPVGKLGSAIAHSVYGGIHIELRAIGAGAVNQACKAVAVARRYIEPQAMDILVRIGFADVDLPDKEVTALTFEIIVDKGGQKPNTPIDWG